MRLFAVTIFLSAFLLFQVQPLIAKSILPWYGSSPAVWTTCMLFFQTLLLAGYAYAHALVRLLARRPQAIVHMALLLTAATILPIIPHRPESLAMGNPTWQILMVLGLTVGLPYTLLAASAPLFQSWFSACFSGSSPYRLYAWSNTGSLLALFSYPLIVEPALPVGQQAVLWSAGFGVLVLAAAACAWTVFRRAMPDPLPSSPRPEDRDPKAVGDGVSAPSKSLIGLWLAYAATGVVVLLAMTNQLCQDIAVIPFLWVLPLSAYLLTFILCFESDRWYRRVLFLTLTVAGTGIVFLLLMERIQLSLWPQVVVYVLLTFTSCMCCHGELARLRPDTKWLTLFYLVVATGGALGGVFVALVAPLIFLHYWELDLGLAATCLLTWLAMLRENRELELGKPLARRPRAANPNKPGSVQRQPASALVRKGRARRAHGGRTSTSVPGRRMELDVRPTWGAAGGHVKQYLAGLLGIGVIAAEFLLGWHMYMERASVVRVERSFYGVLSVQLGGGRRMRDAAGNWTDEIDLSGFAAALFHGRILHGMQYQLPAKQNTPNLYYHEHTGVGRAINSHPQRAVAGRPFRLGVIGLGTGTLAAYARDGDFVRFYEINPAVIGLSLRNRAATNSGWFTFVSDARQRGATVEIEVGDARLVLSRQSQDGQPNRFDVLAVDAFSGDAIPIHLLTRECFELYLEHLAADGVLAFHVSNQYLNLAPVVRRLAADRSLPAICVKTLPDKEYGNVASTWVLVTRNHAFAKLAATWPEYSPWSSTLDTAPLWTDDFSSIFQVLRRG